MKKLFLASAGATFFALTTLALGKAEAATIVLDFEGIGQLNPVGNFYNQAPNNFGITFSPNALALVDTDAGGTGNFGGEPSPETILFFQEGSGVIFNALNGFDTGFSFFYTSLLPRFPGLVTVYDGLNASGNILATLELAITPFNQAPDPTGDYSPLVPIGVSFSGIAKSVELQGIPDQIGFDNITIGSAIPIVIQAVPEPTAMLGILALGAVGATTARKKYHSKNGVPGYLSWSEWLARFL
ncbi:PEP-CTERM sorting domain-containing protein [Nostoc sp. CCY0012]|uniref:PEP-CTERM sorting domain-containing protein n=1 Tax=Nostoc sp. CCY0012 TaxID=1056123 RepID=UPI0039C7387D